MCCNEAPIFDWNFNDLYKSVRKRSGRAKILASTLVELGTDDKVGHLVKVEAGRTDAAGANPAVDVVTTQAAYAYDDFGRKLKETDALGKAWRFEYDKNNNVVKVTDAKSQVTSYTWSYGHRLMTRVSAAGNLAYVRDALGQTTRVTGPEVTYRYTYDAAHRLASVSDSRGGKTLGYSWSPGGLLNTLTDSDGKRADYLYDAAGRLGGIWASNFDYVRFAYDPGGRLTEKWFPNGLTARYSYNAREFGGQHI